MDNNYEKRNDILYTAIYLFSNKGFTATSVQDIASHCNVSKATIYKLFKSKEDILIELIKLSNKQLLLLFENINLNPSMTPMGKFEEKIYLFYEFLASKKDLSIMLYHEQNVCKAEDFKKVFVEIEILILNWFKAMLIDTFGEKVKSIVWDLVITLEGLIRQYTEIFIIKEVVVIDLRKLAKYTTKNITALVDTNSASDPLLSLDFVSNLDIPTHAIFDNELLIEESRRIIDNLKVLVKNSKTILNKEELNEAITTLVNEKNSKEPRKYIIDGLFLYLLKYNELEKDILLLKQIYRKL
ncbi:MAG: TetR/AcrR family transcriptional regulator [Sarcina sp.]